MGQYLILQHIRAEQVNAIAGLTYGFPSVGGFLGLAHALSRDLATLKYTDRIARICILHHRHQQHIHNARFIQVRRPLLKNGATRPIVEEGRMRLVVSLVCELKGHSPFTVSGRLEHDVRTRLMCRRLAGGAIIKTGGCYFCDNTKKLYERVRELYPFAALADRSELLREAQQKGQGDLEAFLSFCELRRTCTRADDGSIAWEFSRNEPGYLVPCHYGYRALTEAFTADEVRRRALRRPEYDAVFAEPVHTVAEWVCSVDKFIEYHQQGRMTWEYFHDRHFYLFNRTRELEETAT